MKKRLPKIKERLVFNWVYKIVALFVALSIWVTTLENKREIMRTKLVKVEMVAPSGRKLLGNSTVQVLVKVVGLKTPVSRYLNSGAIVTLDLANLPSGENHIEFRSENFSLPNGVRMHAVEPSGIDVNLQ